MGDTRTISKALTRRSSDRHGPRARRASRLRPAGCWTPRPYSPSPPPLPGGRAHQTHVGAAIAVYDSTQVWGELDQGLQLFGSARQVAGPAAMDAERSYAKRFPTYAGSDLGAYRFYRFRPRRIKVFDEQTLGAGLFVTAADRGGGGLARTRTELYHGQA